MSTTSELQHNGVLIADTFAEAFPVVGTRIIVTAHTPELAGIAAAEATGNASSVIACDVEAGIEATLAPNETPDGRPGVSILMFAFGRKALGTAVANRVGQNVLTCATTACFNGMNEVTSKNRIQIGGAIRYFGDGYQISKKLLDRRLWRVPVMDGEFICEDYFGSIKGVGGGNLLIAGESAEAALTASLAAVDAMKTVREIILPFPGGIVRSGSKVGSQYKSLKASTNEKWCPTLRSQTETSLPESANAVYEIVVDGFSFDAVQEGLRKGLDAATRCPGVVLISAGNYGGDLGPHHFHLRDLIG